MRVLTEDIGYLPPQNLDAEQAVLGAIILDGDSFKYALQILNPDDFYKKNHGEIFHAMIHLHNKQTPIDIVTLSDYLKTAGRLDEIGGLSYLAKLANNVLTVANIRQHCLIVKDKSHKRQLIATCRKTIENLYADEDFTDILYRHRAEILNITSNIGNNIVSMEDIAKEIMSFVEKRHKNRHEISGISSGLKDIDELTDGFQNGDLIVIGARPGMGKSAFAMHILQSSGVCAGVISLEMSGHQMGIRTLASLSGVNLWHLRTGVIYKEQWPNIVRAGGKMAEMPIYFSFSARKASSIEKVIHEMVDRKGVKTIMVDYLQLVRSDGGSQKREREIAEISNMLKGIAVDYKIPVFAVAQLNRELEKREDKRPILADLRDSGAIEQDADMVLFLYRNDYYNPQSKDKNIMEIIVAKGRNTGTGKAKVFFDGDKMVFRDLMED